MKYTRWIAWTLAVLLLAGCAAQEPAVSSEVTLPTVPDLPVDRPTEPSAQATEATQETLDLIPLEETTVIGTNAPTADPLEGTNAAGQAAPIGPEDFTVFLNGVPITPGDNYNDKLEAVGGDPVIQKGNACIGGGYDTNYYYNNETFTVYTVVEGGAQLVYDIYVTGPGYPSSRGAEVGVTTREALHRLYGEPSSVMAGTDRYTLEGSTAVLSFTFRNGILASYDINNAALAN